MRRLAALCVLLTTVAFSWAAAGHAARAEADLASLTNSDRARHGRAALAVAGDLGDLAQRRAEEMAAARQLSHTSNLGSKVSNWRKLGENVGRGKSLVEIQQSFMASAAHRENILTPDFTQVGVGVAPAGDQFYTAVIFRLPMDEPAPAPAPAPAPKPVAKAAAPKPAPPPPPPPPPTTTTVATAPPPPPPAPVEAPPPPVETTTTVTVAAPPTTLPGWMSASIDPPLQMAAGVVATMPGGEPGLPAAPVAGAVVSLLGVSALLGTAVLSRGRGGW